MGYFDGLVDGSFKTDENGNFLFFPFGIYSKGRIIPNEQKKKELRQLLKRYYQLTLPIILLFGIIGRWELAYGFAFVSIAIFHWHLFRKIRHYEITKSALTLKESSRNSARSHNELTLWFFLIGSILFSLTSVYLLLNEFLWLGISGAAFFALCGITMGHMILVRDSEH